MLVAAGPVFVFFAHFVDALFTQGTSVCCQSLDNVLVNLYVFVQAKNIFNIFQTLLSPQIFQGYILQYLLDGMFFAKV